MTRNHTRYPAAEALEYPVDKRRAIGRDSLAGIDGTGVH